MEIIENKLTLKIRCFIDINFKIVVLVTLCFQSFKVDLKKIKKNGVIYRNGSYFLPFLKKILTKNMAKNPTTKLGISNRECGLAFQQ